MYEVTRDLPTKEVEIETPLCLSLIHIAHVGRGSQPVQKPILLKHGAEARPLRNAHLAAVRRLQALSLIHI